VSGFCVGSRFSWIVLDGATCSFNNLRSLYLATLGNEGEKN
jgi:hypothetical protein